MSNSTYKRLPEIRIGNDLLIRWRILTNGEELPLAGRDLTLTLWHAYGGSDIADFMTLGNVIYWTFRGTDQRYTGDYILTLVEKKGKPGMATVDQKGFRLVGRKYGDNGLMQPTELDLTTTDFVVSNSTLILPATEEKDGLMSKEDKRLVNRYRLALDELTDEVIRGWFYSQDDNDDGESQDPSGDTT